MATTIDASWLSGHTGPPWTLTGPNVVFKLTVDVAATGSFGGEVFKLVGPNVQLDLNGHYVTMNGHDIEQATRSADLKPYENRTENEHAAIAGTPEDDTGGRGTSESPQDRSPRFRSDTGGRKPNTESGTGKTTDTSRGVDQTGRSGRL